MTCSQVHHTQKGPHPKGPYSLRVFFRFDLVWKGEGLTYKCDVQHQDRLKLSERKVVFFNVHPYFGEMIIWLICFQMGGSTTKSLSWIIKLHVWRLPWRFAPQNGMIYIGHKWCALCFNWAMHFHYGLLLHESWHQCKYQSYWVIYTFYRKN